MGKVGVFLLVLALVTACTPAPAGPTPDVGAIYTQAAGTAFANASSASTATRVAARATEHQHGLETLAALPTNTPTPTLTPAPTNTPVPTGTPVPASAFTWLSLSLADSIRSNPAQYVGTYLRALASQLSMDQGTHFLYPVPLSPRGLLVQMSPDLEGDETAKDLSAPFFYVDARVIGIDGDVAKLSAFHVDTIPADQMPREDGTYRVGQELAPGQWKSAEDATTADACYWERIDANGQIIDNFLGHGGAIVYVNANDFAVEFNGCGLMVYLGK